MQQKITTTEMETVTTIVTTCDQCGEEIGRNRRGDYDGYRCSICDRQFCRECHKRVCIKDEDEMKYICPICVLTDNGSLQKIKGYRKKYEQALASKMKIEERWAERSTNMGSS